MHSDVTAGNERQAIINKISPRRLPAFSLIFSSLFRKAEIKSFLSVKVSLISATILGTGDKHIYAR